MGAEENEENMTTRLSAGNSARSISQATQTTPYSGATLPPHEHRIAFHFIASHRISSHPYCMHGLSCISLHRIASHTIVSRRIEHHAIALRGIASCRFHRAPHRSTFHSIV